MRPAQRAQLALLLEVASTPKPGNVDRRRDYPDLRFEHFLAGAVGAADGLEAAADGAGIGAAFERAVAGMADQRGGNTQFGALLLVVPLLATAATGELTPGAAGSLVTETTVADAAGFYRAFDHVDVDVAEPPAGLEALDVRRGSDAVGDVEASGLSLYDVMALSADADGVAREWTTGFERTFEAAERILTGEGPVTDRAALAYLELLAEVPDTFVRIQHGAEAAESVTDRARGALEGDVDVDALAEELVAGGINPGTTADITAGGLFVALESGLVV